MSVATVAIPPVFRHLPVLFPALVEPLDTCTTTEQLLQYIIRPFQEHTYHIHKEFLSLPEAICELLRTPVDSHSSTTPLSLMRAHAAIFATRKDLQSTLSLATSTDRNAFMIWFFRWGVAEYPVLSDILYPELLLKTWRHASRKLGVSLSEQLHLLFSLANSDADDPQLRECTTAEDETLLLQLLFGLDSVAPIFANTNYKKHKLANVFESVPTVRTLPPLNWFQKYLYDCRPDIRARFGLMTRDSREQFLKWFYEHGTKETLYRVMSDEAPIPIARTAPGTRSVAGRMLTIPATRTKYGVNVVGFAKSETGLGEDTRTTALALERAGIPVAVLPVEHPGALPEQIEDVSHLFSHEFVYDVNIFNFPAHIYMYYMMQHPLTLRDSFYNIGYGPWELPSFRSELHPYFSFVDEIWSGSQFIHDAIAPHTFKPSLVMPFGVDVPDFESCSRESLGMSESAFVFFFLFDGLSMIARKNPFAIIEAFQMAFPDEPNVELVIKAAHGSTSDPNWQRLCALANSDSRLRLINHVISRTQLLNYIQTADAFISLHRSEGFGRGLAEAMMLGTPVIATNFSGNTDFMNERNSLPVEYQLVPIGDNYPHSEKGDQWADANVRHAAMQMKRLVAEPAFGAALAQRAAEDIFEHSIACAARRYAERLECIFTTRHSTKRIQSVG